MNTLIHPATCPTWQTASLTDCTCYSTAIWRIRKETGEMFPWRIWRRTSDLTYEPLMRCSTFLGALELVQNLLWLRHNVLQRETNV